MKTLRPIYDFDSYSAPVAKSIYAHLYARIFAPIELILKGERAAELENAATSAVKKALLSGKIQYGGGYFTGSFTAPISKELREMGAVYNKTRKAFGIGVSELPQDILQTISEAHRKSKATADAIEDFLIKAQGGKISIPELYPEFSKTLIGLNKQFRSTTKVVTAEDIEIPLRPELEEKIRDAYVENLDLYINKWYDEQIVRLREKVSDNVAKGYRAENLIDVIQAEKKVSYDKAKFLAKQETSLMVSKYREIRYDEIGVRRYMWSTSRDIRVRHDHRELQGQIFRFDQPPVTNRHTMQRNNPGEDYGCRCVAIPVVEGFKGSWMTPNKGMANNKQLQETNV